MDSSNGLDFLEEQLKEFGYKYTRDGGFINIELPIECGIAPVEIDGIIPRRGFNIVTPKGSVICSKQSPYMVPVVISLLAKTPGYVGLFDMVSDLSDEVLSNILYSNAIENPITVHRLERLEGAVSDMLQYVKKMIDDKKRGDA